MKWNREGGVVGGRRMVRRSAVLCVNRESREIWFRHCSMTLSNISSLMAVDVTA